MDVHAAGGVGKGVGVHVIVVVACWSRVAIKLGSIVVDLFQPVSHEGWVVGTVVVVIVVGMVDAEGLKNAFVDVLVDVDVVVVVVQELWRRNGSDDCAGVFCDVESLCLLV